jgi:holliday junction DNA helicase RuvA
MPPSPADDVVNALLALGYNEKEATAACKELAPDLPLNDAIRAALKLLSKAK